MTIASSRRAAPGTALRAGLLALGLLAGCSSLLPKPAPAPTLFALDDAAPVSAPARKPAASAPTLLVGTPRAAAGFDSRSIVYLRQAHEVEAFAYSQWVDTPAQMLAPLIARAIESTGAFRAVVLAPTSAAAELRLDTELIRLQHEFSAQPSQVRLTLRAVLVETATRRVVAVREFDARVPSASEDPYGGVVAANEAVKRLMADLATFAASEATR
jgi:cholesterol transport system auxiliary component